MGHFMDGLDAEAFDRAYSDRQLLGRIVDYFRPHAGRMGLIAGMIVLNTAMNAVMPILIAAAIDRLAGESSFRSALPLIAAMLASGAFAWLFNYVRQSYTAATVGDVVLKVREDAFDAVLARDMSFYDEYATGKIVSRVTSDTQDFSNVVTLTLNLISQILLVVLIFAILFYIDVRLALITAAMAPVVTAIALAFRRIARRNTTQSRRVIAELNANIQESVTGIGIAKAFRQEAAIYEEFGEVNRRSYRVNLRTGYTFSAIYPLLGGVTGLATAVVVYFGGARTIAGLLTAGQWFLFYEALGIFWEPMMSIASFWSQFQLGLASAERVFALIDAEPRVVQVDDRPVEQVAGRIEFRSLDFRYTEQEQVLDGFDLTSPAGQTVALVGHTGAGKSSLGKLVARFYEFQGGELRIDGQDIRSFDLGDYRRRLGIVPQTPFLFSGTVASNIRYGNEEASDEEITAVAQRIGGGDWLDVLPEGLETEVGEEGRGISMGQRQLVALARVLLQNPSILILDEATASVDPLTEAQIQEGLEELLQGRTAIIIAHRLSTIRSADRIIVLEKGRIIEEGSHEQLMGRGGHYAELYDTYFRHQSPDYDPVIQAARGERVVETAATRTKPPFGG